MPDPRAQACPFLVSRRRYYYFAREHDGSQGALIAGARGQDRGGRPTKV